MDRITPEARSRLMARIGGRNTDPERVVRRALRTAGFGYRLHRRDLPGTPDVAMIGRRVAVFVHGCYWHRHEGCRNATLPKSNVAFWEAKLARNVERDRRKADELRRLGWRVLTVWECATRTGDAEASLSRDIRTWIDQGPPVGELYVGNADASAAIAPEAEGAR
jgi:DNA mismatch endonuclease (patch repair protein)